MDNCKEVQVQNAQKLELNWIDLSSCSRTPRPGGNISSENGWTSQCWHDCTQTRVQTEYLLALNSRWPDLMHCWHLPYERQILLGAHMSIRRATVSAVKALQTLFRQEADSSLGCESCTGTGKKARTTRVKNLPSVVSFIFWTIILKHNVSGKEWNASCACMETLTQRF